jgi:hypothetical protein
MHEVFGIETGFHGTLISAFARLNLDHVVDEVNDETLDPWADLQQAAGISQSTPLSPFMEKELLRDADLSLDGTLLEKETGFTWVLAEIHAAMDITNATPDTSTKSSPKRLSRK